MFYNLLLKNTNKGFKKRHVKGIKVILNQKKSEKRHVKGIKIFLKKKKKKVQYFPERYKNLPEDKKQRLVEYRRNYYITHNK